MWDVVNEAVEPTRAIMRDFEELSMKLGESMSDEAMNALLDRQGALQDRIEVLDGWNLDHRLEVAMDALRLPPKDRERESPFGGRKTTRRIVPGLA